MRVGIVGANGDGERILDALSYLFVPFPTRRDAPWPG